MIDEYKITVVDSSGTGTNSFGTHGVIRFAAAAAQNSSHDPTWWDKFQFLRANGPDSGHGHYQFDSFGSNVDVSNECGPQSETFITIDTNKPRSLAAGSNEIFRLPMRGLLLIQWRHKLGWRRSPLAAVKIEERF